MRFARGKKWYFQSMYSLLAFGNTQIYMYMYIHFQYILSEREQISSVLLGLLFKDLWTTLTKDRLTGEQAKFVHMYLRYTKKVAYSIIRDGVHTLNLVCERLLWGEQMDFWRDKVGIGNFVILLVYTGASGVLCLLSWETTPQGESNFKSPTLRGSCL